MCVQQKARLLAQGGSSDEESSDEDEAEVEAVVWNPEENKMTQTFNMKEILTQMHKVRARRP